jgi:hypothetical protein
MYFYILENAVYDDSDKSKSKKLYIRVTTSSDDTNMFNRLMLVAAKTLYGDPYFRAMESIEMVNFNNSMNSTKNLPFIYANKTFFVCCDTNGQEQEEHDQEEGNRPHNAFFVRANSATTLLLQKSNLNTEEKNMIKVWKSSNQNKLNSAQNFRKRFLNAASALSGFNPFLVWAGVPFDKYCHEQMTILHDLVELARKFHEKCEEFQKAITKAFARFKVVAEKQLLFVASK